MQPIQINMTKTCVDMLTCKVLLWYVVSCLAYHVKKSATCKFKLVTLLLCLGYDVGLLYHLCLTYIRISDSFIRFAIKLGENGTYCSGNRFADLDLKRSVY